MKVVLIYNSKSGGQLTLPKIKQLFRKYKIDVDYSFTVRQLGSNKLKSLVKRGVIIAVIGGDGTQNSVARLLVGSPSAMLPLPGGTLNHFVKDLGMSGAIEDILDGIKTAKTYRIDVGYVNNELFLNNSSLGLYPFTLIDRKSVSKILTKWVAATWAGVRQLIRFPTHRLVIDGRKVHSPFVFVGNNVYDITASLIPSRKSLTNNMLTVMVATSSSRLRLIKAIFSTVSGRTARQQDFVLSHRRALSIYSRHDVLPVSFDGEVKHLKVPLEYKVAAKSLKVMVVKIS